MPSWRLDRRGLRRDFGLTPMTDTNPRSLTDQRQTLLVRRVRWLVAATITYNVIEAIVAITARVAASSTVLIGFGPASCWPRCRWRSCRYCR